MPENTMEATGAFGGAIQDSNGVWRSQTMRTVTFKIVRTDETLEVPMKMATSVWEARQVLAEKTAVDVGRIDLLAKFGGCTRILRNDEQLISFVYVRGIRIFDMEKMQWPHPTAIIGQGYHGQKTAMTYIMEGDTNIVCFDRNEKFGGYCWITGANKTSRLQTEFGSFHIWWGPLGIEKGKIDYPDCNKGGWHPWPYKAEIQKQFKAGADAYGLSAYVYFNTNVSKLEVIGDPKAEERHYKLTVDRLVKGDPIQPITASVIYNYPGSLTKNRIIDYPGEDCFDGEIRYGMNDDTPYEQLRGAKVAILGNGAFAVENARTTLECGGVKAYIITRRKNLASPRMPSWFVHQAPLPTPGGFVLKMFEPMYELADFGDPWQYWSVFANAARTNVTIKQNSRFGIGDVTFLMVIWGLLEYIVGTLKRCSRHTCHLSTGDKLENVTIILKALGLLGDWSVDKLHNMKEMRGQYCSGDWRRFLTIDATGMNAANFDAFSTGRGTYDFALAQKCLHDYPKEFYKVQALGFMDTIPSHQAEPDLEKPAYVTDVKYAMTTSIILDSMCPRIRNISWRDAGAYKHIMYHKAHNTDRILEVAIQEWDAYQADWKSRGIQHDYVPYPYTKELLNGWFKEWSELMRAPISIDGPPEGYIAPQWDPQANK